MIVASRPQAPPSSSTTGRVRLKGRLRQSVCRWCYAKIPLPDFCTAVAAMGLTAVDLLTEKDWPIAREHGLICSMGSGAGGSIADGLNVKANHEKIVAALTRAIPIAAAQKVPNLITFFGNRRGMGDEEAVGELRRGAEPRSRRRRGARRDHLHRAAQQQGRPQGLPGRPHRLRRRDRQGGRLAAGQAALRHLPHADHGRRRDPHDPRQPRLLRALPHRRRPRPPRARRHAGAELAHGRRRPSPTPASRATSRTSSSRCATR